MKYMNQRIDLKTARSSVDNGLNYARSVRQQIRLKCRKIKRAKQNRQKPKQPNKIRKYLLELTLRETTENRTRSVDGGW